ncbi:MAG: archaeosine biosynthesis radical SAM protein RaSEA [Thermoplasmata archaeon]|nr:archaeosine biosynthesis radical SAM protein RaSEA [Thermoplasmata archaeon]
MGRRRPDPAEPVSAWSEKDLLDGEVVDALVIILRSPGCYWSKESGCLMCGYNRESMVTITAENLIAQFTKAMEKHSGQKYIKIYTSGSFLDPKEIYPEARDFILTLAGEKADKILVESRPEFVNDQILKLVLEKVKKLEIAIGLETADDDLRASSINKGFLYDSFERACNTASEHGVDIRTYLILKPPFVSEVESIDDVLASIKKVGKFSQTISINPMNVQRGTVVEGLWKKGLYRPPWLWSLLSVLEQGSKITDTRLVSAPSGGGSRRGVHNCRTCDGKILEAIEKFSLEGNAEVLKGHGCICKKQWMDYLDVEPFVGSTGDLDRLTPPQ